MDFLCQKLQVSKLPLCLGIVVVAAYHTTFHPTDFGMSRCHVSSLNAISTLAIPLKWTAPEALLREEFTFESDVWSWAVTIIELMNKVL